MEGTIFLLVVGALVGYFLPAIIASARKHRNSTAIFLVVMFFGWSVVGWLVALIWAFTSNVQGARE